MNHILTKLLILASLSLSLREASADPVTPMPVTRAISVNPTTGALTWPTAGTFRSANGIEDAGASLLRGTQTFTNVSARNSATPSRSGQIGHQLDDHSFYYSTGTSAGAWSSNWKMNQLTTTSFFLGSNQLTLGQNFVTTGTSSTTLAFPSSTARTYTFPSASASLLATDGSGAELINLNGGTINSGNVLAPFGGTGNTSYTTGDTLYASNGTTLTKLGIGAAGRILKSTGFAPSWSTLAAADIAALSTSNSFLGTNNTAANQSKFAASASTLMVRDGAQWEQLMMMHKLRIGHLGAAERFNNGAGSVAAYDGGNIQLNAGTAAGGYARALIFTQLTINSGSGAGINYARPISLGVSIQQMYPATADGVALRVFAGAGYTVTPAGSNQNALTDRGFGFEIYTVSGVHKLRLFAHNGTTYATSSAITWGDGGSLSSLIVTSDGLGNIAIYGAVGNPPARPSSTALLTMTGGPTTTPVTVSNRYVSAEIAGHSTNTSAASYGAGIIDAKLIVE